jgi:hypothetical protein
MDIKFILNDALNKALITERIKGVPSSNKIADFVNKYMENEQLAIQLVSHSRKTGKTLAMIIRIKATIEQGEKAGVVGCKAPQLILDLLKALGTEAKAEPMIATQPLKAIYETDGFEEYISGFTGGNKKQTGFIFYCG